MRIACVPRLDVAGLVLVTLLHFALARDVAVGTTPTIEVELREPTDSREVKPSARKYPDYCRRDWGLVREDLPFTERRWFDATGRLMFLVENSGRRNDYEYDGEGNVVRAVERFPSGSQFVTTNRYSAARREWITNYSDEGEVYWRTRSAFDAQNRLKTDCSVDPSFPAGIRCSSYEYEGDRLVLIREDWDRGHTELQTRYGYDVRGRISEEEKHVVDLRSGSAGERFYLKRYSYDAEDRRVSSSYESPSLNETMAYHYDPAGNLLGTETRDKDGVVYWAERFSYDCW
jgi:YD repeat-containing protein